jgi:hypothetical protein
MHSSAISHKHAIRLPAVASNSKDRAGVKARKVRANIERTAASQQVRVKARASARDKVIEGVREMARDRAIAMVNVVLAAAVVVVVAGKPLIGTH